jgi:ATP-dependent RNA helicase SUPV3L1/SUV3
MSGFVPTGWKPRVRAVLGPTNTGKTHLALERLLGHASGSIGFPLRLLARENYERMVARKGPERVALVTGEEKIIPAGARWFSCTTESMPLDRPVEFLAVDEIQLAADPDRGHVVTDRLLHARGLVETLFLGAETIRPLLQRLVPEAEVETRPRLSQLTCSGETRLGRLPPRSAVVAFSAAEVYALAELIRRRRGGCAVVMGRLSPRTRNAQVALYQEKEVDFLVATDAIGMGLNLHIEHVAFAGLGKFDGHQPRPLTAAELAQIAGRAGRGMQDGTFGTTATCPPLAPATIEALQTHRFERLERLYWRNSALDFSSVEALLASLSLPPPGPGLARGAEAVDAQTLAALARDPELRALARGRARVQLLWQACQIPDFRKLAEDSHVRLCGRVFRHLVHERRLPTDWLATQLALLDHTEGDIDTLMQRLASVRVWAYVSARADWVVDAAHWQARTRAVEDRLSDALHERLTARFVDRRATHLIRRLADGGSARLAAAVNANGEVVVEGQAVGLVEGFGFLPDPSSEGEGRRLVLRAARRALQRVMPARVRALEEATDSAFAWNADHCLTWNGTTVARLCPGAGPLTPQVEVLQSEFLDGPMRERLRQRLTRFVAGEIQAALAPLLAAVRAAEADAALRGPLHRLIEGRGVVPGATEPDVSPALRRRLKALGVRAGRYALYVPALLKPRAAAMRARLWALDAGIAPPPLPAAGTVSMPPPAAWPAGFAAAIGWVAAASLLLRLDVAERTASEIAFATRRGPAPLPAALATRLGIRPQELPDVLRGLGIALRPADRLAGGAFGPPAPLCALPARRPARPRPGGHSAPPADHPFAVLAALTG